MNQIPYRPPQRGRDRRCQRSRALLASVLLGIVLGGHLALSASGKTVWDGVYVAAQAERGRDLRLRRKIEPQSDQPRFIHTVHGDGYSLTHGDGA